MKEATEKNSGFLGGTVSADSSTNSKTQLAETLANAKPALLGVRARDVKGRKKYWPSDCSKAGETLVVQRLFCSVQGWGDATSGHSPEFLPVRSSPSIQFRPSKNDHDIS